MLSKRTKWIILGVMLGLVTLAAVLWWLSSTPPRWYQPPDAHDAEAGELAALVEHRLAEEVHKIREDESPWRLRIREEQINAWLATRLGPWLEHEQGVQWPSQLGTPQVRFDADTISVALTSPVTIEKSRETHSGRSRTMTLTLAPYLYDDEIRFTLTGIRIGRLAAPGDPIKHVTRLAQNRGSAENENLANFMGRLLAGETGLSTTIKLVDDRHVTLQGLRLSRGAMDVSVITTSANRAIE